MSYLRKTIHHFHPHTHLHHCISRWRVCKGCFHIGIHRLRNMLNTFRPLLWRHQSLCRLDNLLPWRPQKLPWKRVKKYIISFYSIVNNSIILFTKQSSLLTEWNECSSSRLTMVRVPLVLHGGVTLDRLVAGSFMTRRHSLLAKTNSQTNTKFHSHKNAVRLMLY